ncbi:MAG TPA: plastocyanin/azurin family copper-binding protein [Verrucomicrobiae bacterium]|jgi:plastocyanin
MKFTIKTLTVAAIAALFISLQPGFGATTNVIVGFGGALRFSPTNVLISAGDSVIWQWANTTPHSTTSGTNGVPGDDNGVPSGLWDSTVVSGAGHLFTNTFAAAGTFSYYCTLHHGSGMTGEVVVASSSGITTNVIVGFNGTLSFSPTNVLISPGDTVIWQWANTTPHSTTSGTNGVPGDDNGVPSGLWDSTVVSGLGHMFTNTFSVAGVFSYYCTLHHGEGMTGQVIVASSVVVPPTVSITNPHSGAVFAAPAFVNIQATVVNGSSAVTNVEFLVNSAALTNETAAPFSIVAGNLPAGSYTLTAIALDNNDLAATNSVAISVVTPVTVLLSNFLKSGSGFQFSYPANVGLNYVVQRSTNLVTWVPLVTNPASVNPSVFVDSNATNGLDFYRVGQLPNP